MDRNHKQVTIDPLDNQIEIKPFSQFQTVTEKDSLAAFPKKKLFGCLSILTLAVSISLYFIDKSLLLILLLNLLIVFSIYLWNYKYHSRRKPLLLLDKTGIHYKNKIYKWPQIYNLICAEEYDGERAMYSSFYIKFNYQDSIQKINISGMSRSAEEIIHYLSFFNVDREGTYIN